MTHSDKGIDYARRAAARDCSAGMCSRFDDKCHACKIYVNGYLAGLAAGRAEEREAAARVVEDWLRGNLAETGACIAAAIRARKGRDR